MIQVKEEEGKIKNCLNLVDIICEDKVLIFIDKVERYIALTA